MSCKGMRLVNWGVWRPAAAVMRGLRFPGKMALISLVFAIPVVWLLVNFLRAEKAGLDFVGMEIRGVQYAGALFPALEAADHWRYVARAAAFGESATGLPQAQADFEAAWLQLQAQQASLGGALKTGEAWAQTEQALSVIQAKAGGSPKEIFDSMTGLSRSLTDLLAAVIDQSGLSLDPEMGSYYLMSATLMRAPDVIRRTGELRGMAGGSLRVGRIEPVPAMRMAELRAILLNDLQFARQDLQKASGFIGTLGEGLSTEALDATQAFVQAVNALFPPGQSEVSGDPRALIGQANQTLRAQHQQVRENLVILEAMLQDRKSGLLTSLWATLSVTVACLLLVVFFMMGFYRSMFGGFKSLRRHMMAISMGDLRAEIQGKGRDEVSDLLREVGNMQQSLRQTVMQVQGASDSVVQASLEIAKGTRDLSTRTEAAAAALEQSSAALEETTSSVTHTAESARQASEIAVDNARVAERGGAVMQEVVQTMERIQHSSRKINDIIGVIDSIAFQTNILALNAAVEAARAGEQGRGFAVVAGEVRNLAQRSAQAAKEIKTLISSSVSDVDGGMQVVRSAGTTMQEIVVHADQVRQLLDEVASGAREQSTGIGQIGHAVQDLDRNTQSNAALVEETATAAAAQRTAAVRMAAQVDEFQLPSEMAGQKTMVEGVDVDVFIDAHRQWKVKLRDAIELHQKVDTATLCRDDCCALGKWIYGDGQRLQNRQNFMELVEKHKRFHLAAGSVGELVNQRRYREAEDALITGTPFAAATSDVVMALSTAKRLGF